MTLTLDEVRKTKFHMARRTGYEVSEVDLFVDRVEASFAQLTEENSMLKQQVEALKQAQQNAAQQRSVAQQAPSAQQDRREPSSDDLTKQRAAQAPQFAGQQGFAAPQGSRTSGGVERIVVTTSAEASPAVVRLVQMATEQAETLVAEADADAKRKVDEANQKAHQITTDARTKADRVESEARVNAERLTSNAKAKSDNLEREVASRRTQLFADLESERDRLRDSVGALRGFEANYRQSLTSHLRQQIQVIESGRFEPDNKPGLLDTKNGKRDDRPSGRRSFGANDGQSSNTPRLDALLGDNNNQHH